MARQFTALLPRCFTQIRGEPNVCVFKPIGFPDTINRRELKVYRPFGSWNLISPCRSSVKPFEWIATRKVLFGASHPTMQDPKGTAQAQVCGSHFWLQILLHLRRTSGSNSFRMLKLGHEFHYLPLHAVHPASITSFGILCTTKSKYKSFQETMVAVTDPWIACPFILLQSRFI